MLAIIVFMIFITIFIFLQGLFMILQGPQKQIDQRLEAIDSSFQSFDHRDDEMVESLSSRLFKPAIEGFGRLMSGLSPKSKRDKLEILLRRAGKTEKSAVGRWYIGKLVYAFVLPILLGLGLVIVGRDLFKSILFMIIGSLALQLFQTIILKRQVSTRQKEIRNVLADALDLITVSVEAGLSFDGAMDRVIRQMPNALSEEFAIALKEMRMGKTRREGLRALSYRCDVDDLTTLVGALIQADELGVRIGTVLRIQSDQMRERRRQRARETAMKAPIKLLFPLMIFIFPTIFVILLGPAFIQMMDVF